MSSCIFFLKRLFFLLSLVLFSNVLLAGNYNWKNDAASSEWEDPLNWSGTGVPVNGNNKVEFTSADNITIGTTSIAPELSSNQVIGKLTLSLSSLTINNGFILDIKGNTIINGGALGVLGTGTVNIGTSASPVSVTFGSTTSGTTVVPSLNIFTNALILYRTEFKGVLNLTNLSSGTSITGGNTYYENVFFTAAGSGSFRIANGIVSGIGETFKKDLSIKVTTSTGFEASYNYPCFYNGNLILENPTGTYGIRFGSGGGTSELASGATISVPDFSAGLLYFNKFKQIGSTPQSFILNGSSSLTIGANTEFNGPLTCEAPLIVLNDGTFGSEVKLKHKGNINSISIGNVIFNGDFTLENAGTGTFYLATNAGNNYQFKGNSTFINSSTGAIQVSYFAGSSSIFSGHTKIENKGSTGGISFSNLGSCTFNGDIEMRSISSGNLQIGVSGMVTLGAGVKVYSPTGSFTKGNLSLSSVTQQDATGQSIIIGGTSVLTFNGSSNYKGILTCEAPLIGLNGGTFAEVKFKNTGNSNVNSISTGNVVFNGDFTFENSGAGICYLATNAGNIYQFKGNSTFINSSTGSIALSYFAGSSSMFSGATKIENIGSTGGINFSNLGSCTFNGDIEVKSSSSGNFQIGVSGTVTLGAGVKIYSPTGSFTKGNLILNNVTQQDATDQSIVIGGTSVLTFNGSSNYKGILTCEAPLITLNGGTFGEVKFKNTGNSNINTVSNGNVVFNGDFTFENTGAGICYLAANAGNIYQFKGNSTFINSSTGSIALSYNNGSTSIFSGVTKIENNGSTGGINFSNSGSCTFNGDIEVKSSSSGNLQIGVSGTVTLGAGVKVYSPTGSFTKGNLSLSNVTQQDATDQSIVIGGTSVLTFNGSSIYKGILTCEAPLITLNGGTFGEVKFKNTGNSNINTVSNGNVVFNGDFTYENAGAGICFLAANSGNNYQFKGNSNFINSSTGTIALSYNTGSSSIFSGVTKIENKGSTGAVLFGTFGTCTFNGDIEMKSTSTGNFYFGLSGTVIFGPGVKLTSPSGSFTQGNLILANITQQDETDLNFEITGSSILTLGGNSNYLGKVTASSPNLNINGGTFNKSVILTKSGTVANNSSGIVIFNDDFTLNSYGAIALAYQAAGIYSFNGNCTFNNFGSGALTVSHAGVSNFNTIGKLIKFNNLSSGVIYIGNIGVCNFNSDIDLSNSLNGAIYFAVGVTNGGKVNLSANTHLAATNFNSGMLSFRGTKQTIGSPDIELDLSGSRLYIDAGNEFYSNLKITTSLLSFSSSKFWGVVEFTVKNNIPNNNSASFGGSTFYSDFTAINEGEQSLGFNGDVYKGSTTFIKKNTGGVYPSNQGISEYHGNINYNVISPYSLDAFGFFGGGTSVFKGSASQIISTNASTLTFWGGIKLDKESNHVTSINSITSAGSVTFVKGNLIIPSPNYFSFNSNTQAVTGASDQSYIEGVARRYASTAFTFPVGSGGKYMPISISKPSTNEDIRVEAFLDTPPNATTLNNTLSRISSCQYWDVQRVTGSSNISLTIPWASSGCEGINSRDISVAQYKNNLWQFFGANNIVTDGSNGSVTSNIPFTSGYYTFGYIPFDESVFGVLSNKMDGSIYPVKGQKINFRFLEQYKDAGSLKYKIYSNPSDLKDEGTITTSYGYNYESIELQTLGLSDGKLYILEVTDEKNRKSYLKFEFKNN